jgi:hypothetical protein
MMFLEYEKWIVFDVGSWKIKNDCPPNIKKKIQKLLKEKSEREKQGIILD